MLSDEVDRHVCFLSARSCCRRKWWGVGIFRLLRLLLLFWLPYFFLPPFRIECTFYLKKILFFLNGKSRVNISEEMDARPFSASGGLFSLSLRWSEDRSEEENRGRTHRKWGSSFRCTLSPLSLLHSEEGPLSIITTTPHSMYFWPPFF
jgi:hypothetical protein